MLRSRRRRWPRSRSKFRSFEYFWLALLGLTCAVFISTGRPLKGLVVAAHRPAASRPSASTSRPAIPRFTFGSVELLGGVSFIPAMIGMFAVCEVLRWVHRLAHGRGDRGQQAIGNVFAGQWTLLRRYWLQHRARQRRSARGIGALPGAGADIAAWVAYAISQEVLEGAGEVRHRPYRGHRRASTANNAALGGAWVPALVFGIPGDSITAIVIGVLYMKGMNPGPTIMLAATRSSSTRCSSPSSSPTCMLMPLGWSAIKLLAQHPATCRARC